MTEFEEAKQMYLQLESEPVDDKEIEDWQYCTEEDDKDGPKHKIGCIRADNVASCIIGGDTVVCLQVSTDIQGLGGKYLHRCLCTSGVKQGHKPKCILVAPALKQAHQLVKVYEISRGSCWESRGLVAH